MVWFNDYKITNYFCLIFTLVANYIFQFILLLENVQRLFKCNNNTQVFVLNIDSECNLN